jgi:predicted RNA methylase
MKEHQQQIDRWKTRRARALRLLREEGIRGLRQRFENKGGAWPFLKEKARFQACSIFERAWDSVYRVDTSGQIELENLEVIGEHRSFGHSVVSSSPRTFNFLAQLFPADKSNYAFIDVGCGKGRVVLLASQLDFKQVIGVEFSPWAAEIAAGNIRAFRGNRAGLGSCSIVVADALEYQLPNEPLVIYFCNPFLSQLSERFFERVLEAFERHRKPVRICLAGSTDSIDATARALMLLRNVRLMQKGTAPYFLDTYLPFRYYSFELAEPTGPRALT